MSFTYPDKVDMARIAGILSRFLDAESLHYNGNAVSSYEKGFYDCFMDIYKTITVARMNYLNDKEEEYYDNGDYYEEFEKYRDAYTGEEWWRETKEYKAEFAIFMCQYLVSLLTQMEGVIPGKTKDDIIKDERYASINDLFSQIVMELTFRISMDIDHYNMSNWVKWRVPLPGETKRQESKAEPQKKPQKANAFAALPDFNISRGKGIIPQRIPGIWNHVIEEVFDGNKEGYVSVSNEKEREATADKFANIFLGKYGVITSSVVFFIDSPEKIRYYATTVEEYYKERPEDIPPEDWQNAPHFRLADEKGKLDSLDEIEGVVVRLYKELNVSRVFKLGIKEKIPYLLFRKVPGRKYHLYTQTKTKK